MNYFRKGKKYLNQIQIILKKSTPGTQYNTAKHVDDRTKMHSL